MSGIEERLRDALAAKAETVRDDGRPRTVPRPRPAATAEGARWQAPSAVAAAIVLVVALTFVATRPAAPPAPAVRPTSGVQPFAPPIEQVWPDAVHEIPTTMPGGRKVQPETFISSRVVAGVGLTGSSPDSIWSYDTDARTFTALVPPGIRMNASVISGDGHLAWPVFRDRRTEIWVVPATGGVPRRLASVTGMVPGTGEIIGADSLAIAGGAVVWSPAAGGVYRVPLKGGRPTLMSGTSGLHLLQWPWAGSPRRGGPAGPPAPHPMRRLKNVLTGEIRYATAPTGRTSWDECGVTWCLKADEAWRRDGTGVRVLPGQGPARSHLLAGRYVLLRQRDQAGRSASVVHDLATGRTGLVLRHAPEGEIDKVSPALRTNDGMVRYETGRGTQVLLRLPR